MNEEDHSSIEEKTHTNSQHYRVGSQPFSQQSKATTLIKRRAQDIDEDDDFSQDSTIRLDKQEGAFGKKDEMDVMRANNSSVDMNFISDINNECNYLITKFQQDQYVVQRLMNEFRRKSGDITSNRAVTDTSQEPKLKERVLNQDKSNKTVGQQSHMLNQDDLLSSSNPHTITQKYVSSGGGFSHQSLRGGRATDQYATSTHDNKSLHPLDRNLDYESLPGEHDHQSHVVQKEEPRIQEDGSQIQVSSRLDSSKFNITDRPETTLQKQSETIQQSTQRDMMSFRQPETYKQNQQNQDYLLNDGAAQFDLQNFNAFNNKLDSVASSRDYMANNQSQFQSQRSQHQQQLMNIEESPQSNVLIGEQQLQQTSQPSHRYQGNDTQNYEDDDAYDDEEEQDHSESDPDQPQPLQVKPKPPALQNLTDDEEPMQYNPQAKFKPSSPPPFKPETVQKVKPTVVSPPLEQINDDVIYNRLPKGFFAKQEEESKDLDSVLSSIKQMRQDFMGYVSENNIHEKLDEISNIIQPELFIQKHFGEDAEMIFEKVLTPEKVKSKEASPYRSLEDVKQQHQEPKHGTSAIQEEDEESSPDKSYQPEMLIPQSRKQTQRSKRIKSNQESARSIPSKKTQRPPDSHDYQTNQGPRLMKMADYFKDTQQQPPQIKYPVNVLPAPESIPDDQISLNEGEKEQLKQKMEQDILSNIDINFLFNKGEQLRFGLIDQSKAYKIMLKIKEVASQQVERGIREIDYNEIVRYLKEEELYGSKPLNLNEIQMHPNAMPSKIKSPHHGPITPEQWAQVVDFMRKNPKLLLQMLPDNSDDETQDETTTSKEAKVKSKHLQQIEDAKKWAKLQSLSKNFLQKRDLLEAIDREQNARMPSPPLNAYAKERKLSVNKTANKGKRAHAPKQQSKSPPKLQQERGDITNYEASDAEGIQGRDKIVKSNQSRQYQKKLQYNSTSTAQQIYQNPPFIQPDVTQSQQIASAAQLQQQINSNRPLTSQLNARGKSKNAKKGSVLSTMGDVTTLGTTATGHITNLNQYQQMNLIGSQHHQTIDEYANYGTSQPGVMSMLQQYNDEGKIINGMSSQRRPTTASAAQQNNRSLAHFMKPVLQQRQESFDAQSSKINRFQRGTSLSKNYQTRKTYGESSDLGNQSVVNNYLSQNGNILELSQSNINPQNLNNSYIGGGSNLVGPQFAPISLGPSRRTQKFIEKMAPNLKENELYPKFVNGARRSTASSQSNAFHQKRLLSNDAMSTSSQQQIQTHNRNRRLLEANRRSDLLNLSQANLDTSFKDDQSQYADRVEQTPQGAFPKFIKRQLTSQSNSSRKELQQQQIQQNNAKTQTQPPKFVNQHMQTRIGGLSNKLLISPMSGTVDPFAHDNLSQMSKHESVHSQDQDKFVKKHLKMPVVDWAYTSLFQKALNEDLDFNSTQDISLYLEKEVDYVIDMMKSKFKDFKRSDIMRPFFLKALNTLKALLIEQNLTTIYEQMEKKYKEVTIENTMKLLIRCKLAFHQRSMLIDILKSIITYELQAVHLKSIIDKHSVYLISSMDHQDLTSASDRVFESGHSVLVSVKALRSVHKQFKTPFIFKKKDYVNYVKNEMNEIKKLVSIFKVTSADQPIVDLKEQQQQLRQIEENKNETEEQSYYSTDRQSLTHQL